MKANAPIFYILSQIGVFCIIYTLLLASHRTSFAVDFCDPAYGFQTGVNLIKVTIFVALIHAPGVVVAHRFAEIAWPLAALPLLASLAFVSLHYANDFMIGNAGSFPCETGLQKSEMRSIFRPVWQSETLALAARAIAYSWGCTSLFVLFLCSRLPTDFAED